VQKIVWKQLLVSAKKVMVNLVFWIVKYVMLVVILVNRSTKIVFLVQEIIDKIQLHNVHVWKTITRKLENQIVINAPMKNVKRVVKVTLQSVYLVLKKLNSEVELPIVHALQVITKFKIPLLHWFVLNAMPINAQPALYQKIIAQPAISKSEPVTLLHAPVLEIDYHPYVPVLKAPIMLMNKLSALLATLLVKYVMPQIVLLVTEIESLCHLTLFNVLAILLLLSLV
jgi:hypothetical protein